MDSRVFVELHISQVVIFAFYQLLPSPSRIPVQVVWFPFQWLFALLSLLLQTGVATSERQLPVSQVIAQSDAHANHWFVVIAVSGTLVIEVVDVFVVLASEFGGAFDAVVGRNSVWGIRLFGAVMWPLVVMSP